MTVTLGASETPAAMGLDAHGVTPWQLWARKVGLLDVKDEPTEVMEWGTELEPVILRRFITQELGRESYARSPHTARHLGQLRATPDAVVYMEGPHALVEVKCVIGYVPHEPRVEWVVQCLAQRRVFPECERQYLVAFGGLSLEWWGIPKHQRALDAVARAQDHFLDLCEREEPPPVRAEDASVLAKQWPLVKPYVAQLPPEALAWDREYAQGQALEAQGREMKKLAQAHIEAAIGDAEAGALVIEGRLVSRYTWKPYTKKEFTVKAQTVRPLKRYGPKGEEAE